MKIYNSTYEIKSNFMCGDIIVSVDKSLVNKYQRFYFDIVIKVSSFETESQTISFWNEGIYFDCYSEGDVDYKETEIRCRKNGK